MTVQPIVSINTDSSIHNTPALNENLLISTTPITFSLSSRSLILALVPLVYAALSLTPTKSKDSAFYNIPALPTTDLRARWVKS